MRSGVEFEVPIECDRVVVVGIPDEFTYLCKQRGTTPLAMLSGFMADAANIEDLGDAGFITGGSDERRMAEDYVCRRWFP